IAPIYLATADYGRLFVDPGKLAFHAVMQGVVAAVIAIVAFSQSVRLLGAGEAGIFPSLVPVLAVLFGIPFLGEWPTAIQIAGIAMATVGLALASGALSASGPSSRRAAQRRTK
ncbi:MAG: EamA family transporter, partial [Pseudomonadota bacterium]